MSPGAFVSHLKPFLPGFNVHESHVRISFDNALTASNHFVEVVFTTTVIAYSPILITLGNRQVLFEPIALLASFIVSSVCSVQKHKIKGCNQIHDVRGFE